jgi:membrane protease YdiL (CAAX protease family)
MNNQSSADIQEKSGFLPAVTWLVTILVSTLPNAVWQSITGSSPSWLVWIKIGLLIFMVLITFSWKMIQPLRLFFLMLLVLVPAYQLLSAWLPTLHVWRQWFGYVEWLGGTAVIQFIKIGFVFVMVGALKLSGQHRNDYFLVKGQLNAPAGKILWLGIKERTSWAQIGPVIMLFAFIPVTIVLWLSNPYSSTLLVKALPYLPAAILFAAMNGFSEEMTFRAPVLSALQGKVSSQHALLLTAVYFGLAHFSGGISSGIVWVVFAGFLGWLLGKSMLETKGIFWAWLIHFIEDIPIYFFMAIDYLM